MKEIKEVSVTVNNLQSTPSQKNLILEKSKGGSRNKIVRETRTEGEMVKVTESLRSRLHNEIKPEHYPILNAQSLQVFRKRKSQEDQTKNGITKARQRYIQMAEEKKRKEKEEYDMLRLRRGVFSLDLKAVESSSHSAISDPGTNLDMLLKLQNNYENEDDLPTDEKIDNTLIHHHGKQKGNKSLETKTLSRSNKRTPPDIKDYAYLLNDTTVLKAIAKPKWGVQKPSELQIKRGSLLKSEIEVAKEKFKEARRSALSRAMTPQK